jgi:beta-galactosidase
MLNISMKKLFLTLILFCCFEIAYSQVARHVVSFNNNWEIFRLDTAKKLKNVLSIRNSTSFSSQFNQQVLTAKNEPADSSVTREVKAALIGFSIEYPKISSSPWQKISLPHPARYEQEENPGVNQFTGICYYRKQFFIPENYGVKHVSLRFEGAMQTAAIWINGKFVSYHAGGYLPFIVDLDNNLNYGGSNEIIVRLDNRDNASLPPGKALAELGFLYWSGIYRNVSLTVTSPVYITDANNANTVAGGGVFVRPENISAKSADVFIKTQIFNNTDGCKQLVVKQILFDGKNKIIDSSQSSVSAHAAAEVNAKIFVLNPRLWSPDDPHLYNLSTQVWSAGKLLDNITQKIGIRKLSFTRSEGFKLNDMPLKIVGTNRHQDYPFVGNALSDEMQYRDLKRIKEAGFNFVRLSHYPQAPAVYQYCDSIGLMLGDPIPGWQFFNQSAIFKDRVFSDIREMIRRDRNHPSVIMWEVSLNETYPADSFRVKSAEVAHEEYPGINFFTAGDTYGAKITAWDIPYNSWQDPFGRPQNVQPDKPGFVREYGDYEFGGSSSTTRTNRSKGEKALLQNAWNFQWEHNLLMGPKYYPWTIGDASWAFFDGFESFTKGTSDWGIMDIFRVPKFSYYFFKSQLDPYKKIFGANNKPMVYIANWWTPTSHSQKVIIYANCDEVAIYINGKLIKKQLPDAGPDTDYGDYDKGGNSFDGGDGKNLNHPPFTFNNVRWQPGTLKAVGFIKGRAVAQDLVNSPLSPNRITLSADTVGIPLTANGVDAIFVHAGLVDQNGTVMCLDNQSLITFNISGPGIIIGPEIIKTRGGIATVLVRANSTPGKIVLTASSKGMAKKYLIINSK